VLRLRRTTWPAELVTAVRAAAGDREDVLAAIQTRSGPWAAGSRSAVYLPVDGALDGAGVRRVAWELVERAEWNSDESTFHLWESAEFGTPMRRTDLVVDDPGRFGQLVRERISASVLLQRHVPLVGKKGVRIVGRRNPSRSDAPVTWNLVLDNGLDPATPGLLDRAENALQQVRDELDV
jgi:hypothetical protein